MEWTKQGLDFALKEAISIQDNLFKSSNWTQTPSHSACAASTLQQPCTDKDLSCSPFPANLRLCNDDIEHLLCIYACPLHRSETHTLFQCDALLNYFNITLKEVVSLPKELRSQPAARHTYTAPPMTSPSPAPIPYFLAF
eukprot:8695619-Ditylum_brightwellii.AAC.1